MLAKMLNFKKIGHWKSMFQIGDLKIVSGQFFEQWFDAKKGIKFVFAKMWIMVAKTIRSRWELQKSCLDNFCQKTFAINGKIWMNSFKRFVAEKKWSKNC